MDPFSHSPCFRTLFQSSYLVFACSPIAFVGFDQRFPLFHLFPCMPPFLQIHRHTHTLTPFYKLILLSSALQLPREYCLECVRTTINTQSPSRYGCASAPGTSTAVNSFAALLSATRRSTTGCWTLQRRRDIPSSRVCLCFFICSCRCKLLSLENCCSSTLTGFQIIYQYCSRGWPVSLA